MIQQTNSIRVCLTTTKYALRADSVDTLNAMYSLDLPVCVVESEVVVLQSNEKEEYDVASKCVDFARGGVYIDVSKKTLFIGKNPNDEKTGLVVYQSSNDNDPENNFFIRWGQKLFLFFEFQVTGIFENKMTYVYDQKSHLFTIQGMWQCGRWNYLDINYHSKLSIESE